MVSMLRGRWAIFSCEASRPVFYALTKATSEHVDCRS